MRGESWREVSGNLPTDFGFTIDVHAHEPETIYVVPIKSDSEHYPPDGKLRVYRSRSGGDEWEALTKGLPQKDCYVNVLRDAMAVDSLDSCGVYFGTTGGQVYASADAGDNWTPIVRDLPPVVSVEVQTLCNDPSASFRRTCGRWRKSTERSRSTSSARSTQRAVLDALEAQLSCAARHDPRPRHAEAPVVRALLRVRRRSLPRSAGHAASRRGRDRRRAFPRRRGDGRRLGATDNTTTVRVSSEPRNQHEARSDTRSNTVLTERRRHGDTRSVAVGPMLGASGQVSTDGTAHAIGMQRHLRASPALFSSVPPW